MVALQVEDIKIFMNKLFKDISFDELEIISMDLSQVVNFSIDGTLNHTFLDTDDETHLSEQRYIKWVDLKPTIYALIKGNKSPSSMKIIFTLSQKSKLNLVLKSNSIFKPEDINGFYLNIVYENNNLKVVTGTNYKLFTLDKSIEHYFDDSILRFFYKHEIPVSNMNA